MKAIKKILSIVGLSVLCTAPILNTLNVSASYVDYSHKYDTYSIYCDVPANSGVMWTNLVFDYKYMDIESYIGDFGGDVFDSTGSERPDGECSFAACYRADGVVTAPGNLFRTNFYTQNGFTARNISTTSFDGNRVVMKKNPVTYEIVLVGDANGDKDVDIADAAAIFQYLGNTSAYPLENLRAADTNFDGIVTSEDAYLIQQLEAGVINGF